MDNLSLETRTFLEKFFGPGNAIRWDAIVGGGIAAKAADDLASWIEDLEGFNRPVLLPRGNTGDLLQWYALAFTPQQGRALREDLMAFVGPTWTCFAGQTAILDPADPVEAAILELKGQATYRIDVPFKERREDVRRNLMQMRRMWKERPLRGRSAIRPTGRIVRDFEMALQSGDLELADRCLAELRGAGKLSAPNLTFLRVRRQATAGAWQALLESPELPMLLSIRRPALVTEALLEAVYAQVLARFEKMLKPREALDAFRQDVLPKYAALFRARGPIRSPGALKAFLLYAAAASPPRPELRDALLADFPGDAEGRSYAEALAGLVVEPTSAVLPLLDRARHAFFAQDFDTAYVRLLECEPISETLQMLMATALQLGTLEASRSAIQRMEAAPAKVRDAVLGFHTSRRDWTELQELAGARSTEETPTGDSIPSGWLEWIERLSVGCWPTAMEMVDRGRLEWEVTELQTDPAKVQRFCDLLNNMPPTSMEVLRLALPQLLQAFLSPELSVLAFKPLYLALLCVLALDDGIGGESLEAIQDLAGAVLEGDHTPRDYAEVVEYLVFAWTQLQSSRLLDSALDMLDLLVALPCKDQVARLKLWAAVTETFQNNMRRVEGSQWALYRILSEEVQKGENAQALFAASLRVAPSAISTESAAGNHAVNDLRGKTIAIYTLTESVARRGKGLLEAVFPNVRVELSSDHVASDRLRSMAENADFFIIATRSAKHAATNFIRQCRPPNRPVLYPAGKGTASILRSLFDHLAAAR